MKYSKDFKLTLFITLLSFSVKGQILTFEKDLKPLVTLSKSDVHEKMVQLGYTLEHADKETPSPGYNKLFYNKKISKKDSRDSEFFYYNERQGYSFIFENENDDKIIAITFSTPNQSSLLQLKTSFLKTYKRQAFTTTISNDCLEQKSTTFNLNGIKCYIVFVDCSYKYPDNSGKRLKTYACDLYLNR